MKKMIFSLVLSFVIYASFVYPKEVVFYASSGISTWFHQILPSLLPFSIFSGILCGSHWMESLPLAPSRLAKGCVLLFGFAFGFPIGAKLSSDFYRQGYLAKKEALLLCITSNNFSFSYVLGYCLPLLLPEQEEKIKYVLALYLVPFLAAVAGLIWIMIRTHGRSFDSKTKNQKNTASRFQLDMQIIDAGIISGFESLIRICGYIVLFSVAFGILKQLLPFDSAVTVIALGFLEVTNGIVLISNAQILSASLCYLTGLGVLSTGGICGILQTASFLKSADLPIKDYLLGKILLMILILVVSFNIYN